MAAMLCICLWLLVACDTSSNNSVSSPSPGTAATPTSLSVEENTYTGPPLVEVLQNSALVDLTIGANGEGWAVGQNEVILHLQGVSWSVEQAPPRGGFSGSNSYLNLVATSGYSTTGNVVTMEAEDTVGTEGAAEVWAYSNHNELLRRTGGRWETVLNPSQATLSDLVVTQHSEAWAVGKVYGGVMSSNVQGASMYYKAGSGSWSVVELPSEHGSTQPSSATDSVTPSELAVAPDGAVWALAGNVMLRATAGAERWELLALPTAVTEDRLADLAFSADGTLWVLGDKAIWRYQPSTQDQGENQREATPGGFPSWEPLAGENIESTLEQWHGASLSVSQDGSQAWVLAFARTPPGTPAKQAFLLLDTEAGKLTHVSSPTDLLIQDVEWARDDEAWAVGGQRGGGQGIILHYLDGEWSIYDPAK
jgi:hypothetical protein